MAMAAPHPTTSTQAPTTMGEGSSAAVEKLGTGSSAWDIVVWDIVVWDMVLSDIAVS